MLEFPYSGVRICHGMAHMYDALSLYSTEIERAGRVWGLFCEAVEFIAYAKG
jgi:hypothetical protein